MASDQCCCDRDHVTIRELDVLVGLGTGSSTAKIAVELALSEYTVTDYITKLLRKFHAANRVELVAKGFAFGILTQWPPQATGRRCVWAST